MSFCIVTFKDSLNCIGMWPFWDNISTVNTLMGFSLSGEEAFEREQSLNVSCMNHVCFIKLQKHLEKQCPENSWSRTSSAFLVCAQLAFRPAWGTYVSD